MVSRSYNRAQEAEVGDPTPWPAWAVRRPKQQEQQDPGCTSVIQLQTLTSFTGIKRDIEELCEAVPQLVSVFKIKDKIGEGKLKVCSTSVKLLKP